MGSSLLLQACYVVIYIALARLTTPTVFGVFAAGAILIAAGELLTESGMTAAMLQRREHVEAAAVTALVSMFLGGVLLAIVALALSPLIGLFFHSREIGLVAAALSGHLVLNGLTGAPLMLLQKRFALRRWTIEPVAVVAWGATSAAGLAGGLGVWALVLGWYAATVTRLFGAWIAARWKPDLRLTSFRIWRDLARYARHVLAGELLRESMRVANTALIGRFLGPSSLGQFRFAWRLVSQITAPITLANGYTLQPSLVRLSDDDNRVKAAALSAFRVVSATAFPVGAVLIAFSDSLAVGLLGEAWRDAGPIMFALSGMGIALPMLSVSAEIFKARGRPDMLPRMHALYAGTSILLVAVLVNFGAVAVAIGWSVSTVCVVVYALSRVPRILGISWMELPRTMVPPLICALVSAIALRLFNLYVLDVRPNDDAATLLRLGVEIAIGAALYLAGMALLARGTLRELRDTASTMLGRDKAAPLVERG